MMEQDKFHSSLLSKIATGSGHGEDSPYFDGWKAYDNDPFHPIHNPNGVIQMGLAENQLCSDMIEDWITRNPESSFGSKEGCSQFLEIANFQDYHGLPAFRTAVSKFMEKIRGGRVKFDPDRIVMSGGATGAHEVIAFCLADPGEAFLVPTPYYPGFDRDLRWRTGVQLFPIICSSRNNFQVTRTALESAYRKAQIANIKVKGVLITNPSNPLGTTINRRTLNLLFNFTNQHNLHLVCDEIYAGTTFKYPDFISISELMQEYEQNNIKFNPQLIHVVYSLSKDMGLPGFRIGIIYSYNDSVVRCARRMSSFGLVSTQTQFLIARMLSDDEFVDDFISQLRRRLAERKERFVDGLRQVGINCLESNAGLFCWMNLRKLLTASTEEEEIELWKIIINEVKLNVSPGSSFHCSEPGWFRVCFANMDEETMNVAMKRIRRFMFNSGGTRVMTKKEEDIRKEKWQASLRLSFSKTRRRYEEVILSPNPGSTMSPHSPLVPPIS